ncbi:Transposase, partial [Schistosoma japonicum]
CLACSSQEIHVDLKSAFENVVLNRLFFSWEDVEQAVEEFQSITFTYYIHSQCQSASLSSFKYIFVVFKCAFGNKWKLQGIGQRNKPSKYLDCKSMFRVVLNVNEYIVRSYIMTHNHPCSKSFMRCDPWFRRLSEEEKENLNPVLLQSSSCDPVMEHVRNKYQKELISDDIRNMKSKTALVFNYIRERGQLREFRYVEGIVRRLSPDRSCYLDVVVGLAYRNDPTEPYWLEHMFLELLITDNMGRGRPVMFAWTKKEFTADVRWVLDMFQEIMGDTSSTETFVMDSSYAEIAAVSQTHRNANIQLCSFHVCRALCRKTRDRRAKAYLCRLVSTESKRR